MVFNLIMNGSEVLVIKQRKHTYRLFNFSFLSYLPFLKTKIALDPAMKLKLCK